MYVHVYMYYKCIYIYTRYIGFLWCIGLINRIKSRSDNRILTSIEMRFDVIQTLQDKKMGGRVAGELIVCLSVCVANLKNEWMNCQWMNEWMTDWMNEWMNERTNEWANECMHLPDPLVDKWTMTQWGSIHMVDSWKHLEKKLILQNTSNI